MIKTGLLLGLGGLLISSSVLAIDPPRAWPTTEYYDNLRRHLPEAVVSCTEAVGITEPKGSFLFSLGEGSDQKWIFVTEVPGTNFLPRLRQTREALAEAGADPKSFLAVRAEPTEYRARQMLRAIQANERHRFFVIHGMDDRFQAWRFARYLFDLSEQEDWAKELRLASLYENGLTARPPRPAVMPGVVGPYAPEIIIPVSIYLILEFLLG